MTIRETCGCGAVLEFTSTEHYAAFDIKCIQRKFHASHEKCRETNIPQLNVPAELYALQQSEEEASYDKN